MSKNDILEITFHTRFSGVGGKYNCKTLRLHEKFIETENHSSFLTLVSAEVAAGGEPAEADAAPSSLAPDMEPEGVLLCEGACNESPESCFDMMPPLGALTHTTVVSCSISFIVIFLVL